MNVYVVTMYRMGERANESYVLGAFSTEARAKLAAREEAVGRGLKYGYGIASCQLDVVDDDDDELDEIVVAHDRNAWDADEPS